MLIRGNCDSFFFHRLNLHTARLEFSPHSYQKIQSIPPAAWPKYSLELGSTHLHTMHYRKTRSVYFGESAIGMQTVVIREGTTCGGGAFFTAVETTRPGAHPRTITVGPTPKYRGMPSGPRIYRAVDCRYLFSTDTRIAKCCICKLCYTTVDKGREGFEVNCYLICRRPREKIEFNYCIFYRRPHEGSKTIMA